ncbi:PEP-CTERM sorting domain-containing protein [Nostoc sp.]|uniref:PEP-CTERM sorting domain-containing protein n=1 Tax=Nostoc sp. TaxID=1180 RepID=UPI002FF6E4B9
MKLSLQSLSIRAALVIFSCVGISQAPASAASIVASPVNLLVNGSFEDTTLSGTSQAQLTSGWQTYSKINGWSATPNGQIEVQHGIAGTPYAGSNLAELDSHNYDPNKFSAQNPLGFYQDVTTVAGQNYTLSFAYSARPNTAAEQNIFDILVGDVSNPGNIFKQTISDGAGGSDTAWSIFTKTFKATSGLSRVQFNYNGPLDTYGAYIDDVKLVTAVPEPSAITGIVLAGLGLVTLKKRNASKKSLVV